MGHPVLWWVEESGRASRDTHVRIFGHGAPGFGGLVLGGGCGGVGTGHDEGAGGGAEGDLFALECLKDSAAEFAEDTVALVSHDADVDEVIDFAAVDFVDAEDGGLVDDDLFECFIVAEAGGEVLQDGDNAVGIDGGVDANGE
jgi:hypothetical protein